uniref:4-hydroxy 2-oxovalerate aldolase n=1 Tax=Candidatus Kentrum sp. DK TaxID=2126562 RepID=A0A450T1Y2_9GAMM|nr:MAG: 4-hydroxy 2-oxovalerate aldolase [Candidatus Kentron sp. DK]
MNTHHFLLDCTLRDGGYYNNWDFEHGLVCDYLGAMKSTCIDFVEIGFRSLQNNSFKGAYAYTTDEFVSSLPIPEGLRLGVMVNAAEVLCHPKGVAYSLGRLFHPVDKSPITFVRVATHFGDLDGAMRMVTVLKDMGYMVGINLMQISECSKEDLYRSAKLAEYYQPDVFYFADSLGHLLPHQIDSIVDSLRDIYSGAIGIHAHDNMGNALSNTLHAYEIGVGWLDGTVTGMGRGPGNAMTEYLAIELDKRQESQCNITALLSLIETHFTPMKARYGWGTNPYYYFAGKFSIHPTYIQEMLGDNRYSNEDILAVLEQLKAHNAAKYDAATLKAGRHFYGNGVMGCWKPKTLFKDREVLIVGAGSSVSAHATAIQSYIHRHKPFVIALNTEARLDVDLIDVRAACHPVRLLADCTYYKGLSQPLATPTALLSDSVRQSLKGVKLLDYGLQIKDSTFECADDYCIIPTPLVAVYALAIATSGGASRILLAGFDGYSADDPRRTELDTMFSQYSASYRIPYASITPTKLQIPGLSVYAL